MGFIDDLINLVKDPLTYGKEYHGIVEYHGIATEADDITEDASNLAKDMSGADDNSPSSNNDISLNTDNILADDDDSNNSSDNNNPDMNDEETDDPSTDDESDNENNEDSESDENESSDETSMDDQATQDAMDSKEDPFSASRKIKMFKKFRNFHDTISDSIDLISKYVPKQINPDTIRMLTGIKDNLTEAKDIIYDILTNDFQKMEYPELEKKYTGLSHVYDICIMELQEYFDKYREEK